MGEHHMDFQRQREALVGIELKQLGISDPRVLRAMLDVPREEFVPPEIRESSYQNVALPIELGQTISQPLIVAEMIEAMRLSVDDRVLEIGTGSGYGAAVLSRIVRDVYTVERHATLAAAARELYDRLGYRNIHVRDGDGSLGWPEYAPFDAIVVTAAAPTVPEPLLKQLSIRGRLVVPVGETYESQRLVRVIRKGAENFRIKELCGVRFVPLIGEAGWDDSDDVPRE